MSQSLTLPDPLYNKLAQGAADRGMTEQKLLAFLLELISVPEQPTGPDRVRSRRIEQLLDKYRTGPLTEQDRLALNRLIDADYQEAMARADRLIAAKKSPSRRARGSAGGRQLPQSSRRGHASRK
jgi:hypothetical protein